MIKAASLFSGVGIGEYYLKSVGIDVVLANEIVTSRSVTHQFFYPNCFMVNADITEKDTQDTIIGKSFLRSNIHIFNGLFEKE